MCVEIEILIFITYESTDMPLICYGYMHIQIYMCVYIYIYSVCVYIIESFCCIEEMNTTS